MSLMRIVLPLVALVTAAGGCASQASRPEPSQSTGPTTRDSNLLMDRAVQLELDRNCLGAAPTMEHR